MLPRQSFKRFHVARGIVHVAIEPGPLAILNCQNETGRTGR